MFNQNAFGELTNPTTNPRVSVYYCPANPSISVQLWEWADVPEIWTNKQLDTNNLDQQAT
jgi:hypothetical protein